MKQRASALLVVAAFGGYAPQALEYDAAHSAFRDRARVEPGAQVSPLSALSFLAGDWSGEIEGTIGTATGARQYRFIMQDRFYECELQTEPSRLICAGLFTDHDHFTEVFEVRGADGGRQVRMEGRWTRGPSSGIGRHG